MKFCIYIELNRYCISGIHARCSKPQPRRPCVDIPRHSSSCSDGYGRWWSCIEASLDSWQHSHPGAAMPPTTTALRRPGVREGRKRGEALGHRRAKHDHGSGQHEKEGSVGEDAQARGRWRNNAADRKKMRGCCFPAWGQPGTRVDRWTRLASCCYHPV